MPKFSVVIPIYNKARFLKKTLQSVLDQTFRDFEIIAVNDGSTDGSLSILKSFSDDRILIIDQKNQGLSQSRNNGIAAATGELVALLDADDLWKPNHLYTLNQLNDRFPTAAVLGVGYEESYGNNNVIKPDLNLDNIFEPQIITDFFLANMKQPIISQSSMALKPDVIKNCGGFDPNVTYAEDVDFYIRLFLKNDLAYDPTITCRHTMNAPEQITRSKKSERKVPNFQKYLEANPKDASLKRFINLKRYFLAIFYKVEGNVNLYRSMRDSVDTSLLTKRQRQLLRAPKLVVIVLRKIKSLFLKSGKRLTSFNRE
ncbi:MAG: glycosyltransferase [Leeuwenhoekiella sp.]